MNLSFGEPLPPSGPGFEPTVSAPRMPEYGSYTAMHMLSVPQFSQEGAGFRFRQEIGGTRIMHSKGRTTFSVGGGGYRIAGGGKLSHVLKSE